MELVERTDKETAAQRCGMDQRRTWRRDEILGQDQREIRGGTASNQTM